MPVVWSAVAFTVVPIFGGLLSGLRTRKEVKAWYKTLKTPTWTPPDWVFAPMWTSLYTGMGFASYLVWRDGGGLDGSRLPLALYGSQLLLNFAWSPIFFTKHDIKLAFYTIIALYANAAACGFSFYQVNRTAGYLFVPYLGWLTVATALNYKILHDNPAIEDVKKE